jgi:hypothetical protein
MGNRQSKNSGLVVQEEEVAEDQEETRGAGRERGSGQEEEEEEEEEEQDPWRDEPITVTVLGGEERLCGLTATWESIATNLFICAPTCHGSCGLVMMRLLSPL